MSRFVRDSGPLTAKLLLVGNEGDLFRFISLLKPKREGCWLWKGSHNDKGYAKFWFEGKTGLAMHFVAKIFRIRNWNKPKREPDHLCRVRGCCNPYHLQMVTRRINLLRGNSPVGINARKLVCIRGHAFDEENTAILVINGREQRRCRACHRRVKRAEYKRDPEKFKARVRAYKHG